MLKQILFLTTGLLVVAANHHRIVDGGFAKEGQFPYIARIATNDFVYCGGSIVNKNTIITAAHCIKYDVETMSVTLGTINFEGGGVEYFVESQHIHPEYTRNPQTRHDVAILKLKKNIEFTDLIQPIELHKGSPYDFTNAVTSGWGSTDSTQDGVPETLKFANVKILDQETCESKKGHPADTDFCVVSEHGNVCYGDSGGPIAAEGKLIGCVSWGWSPCGIQKPGVFARIDVHMDFIEPLL